MTAAPTALQIDLADLLDLTSPETCRRLAEKYEARAADLRQREKVLRVLAEGAKPTPVDAIRSSIRTHLADLGEVPCSAIEELVAAATGFDSSMVSRVLSTMVTTDYGRQGTGELVRASVQDGAVSRDVYRLACK